ncbi:MAG: alpha/beta fold hydrolase [Gemmatimonadota bacterium]|nr:alpha/beta fold hydrolase [Gemmatimonadota bacterium]MDH3366732.1 alpha/beta fold hydrolase [Gemmatimonadota bacterium]MDH3478837.1 alpha/beta fold hydrolase [Gemmatimonadota bacterium]MDH3569021.1 alpha/beta fold hydrolase [Gemmatimonadota bacterium]MDH5550136.1 alpha/beta fold hydrolase [Gemmatimonadota bacterium]
MANRLTLLLSPAAIVAALCVLPLAGCADHVRTVSGMSPTGLFYEVSGAGEPVVLIHAFSLDRRMWEPQVTAFQNRFQVIRYDLRGHGKSIAPTEPYTGFDDLRALLDTLGIGRASLVGLSAGSELAINFAIAYPDRVARLVLAAPGLGGYAVPRFFWFLPVLDALADGDAERAARRWAETPIMALHSNVAATETVTSLVMDNARLWTYQRSEQPLSPPAIDRLAEITCPALVIVGDQDLPYIQDVARILDEDITGAELVTIPGAGHIVNLDTPVAFNDAVLAFLEQREQ